MTFQSIVPNFYTRYIINIYQILEKKYVYYHSLLWRSTKLLLVDFLDWELSCYKRYRPCLTSPKTCALHIKRGLQHTSTRIKKNTIMKLTTQFMNRQQIISKVWNIKNILKRKWGWMKTLSIWVIFILKELGKLIFKRIGIGVRNRKELESQHMCSEAPESVIQVS